MSNPKTIIKECISCHHVAGYTPSQEHCPKCGHAKLYTLIRPRIVVWVIKQIQLGRSTYDVAEQLGRSQSAVWEIYANRCGYLYTTVRGRRRKWRERAFKKEQV